MNIERGNFDDDETPEEREDTDTLIAAAAAAAMLHPEYAARFASENQAAADARARADIAAGRFVDNDKVIAWLRTWGTPDEGPPPREWFE